MSLWERSRIIGLTALLLTLGAAAPAQADEVEQVVNGGFDGTADPFWANGGMTIDLSTGPACVDVPGGTTNRWDAAVGQNDIDLVAGENYRFSFDASGDAGHVVRAITGLSVEPYDTYFEQSPVLSDGGRIISIGSVVGDTSPFAGLADYSATKGAVAAYTRGWARDFGPRGITVNNVQPGPIDTDMNPAAGPSATSQASLTALGRYGKPNEIAAAVAFLAGPGAGYITGAQIAVDGGTNA